MLVVLLGVVRGRGFLDGSGVEVARMPPCGRQGVHQPPRGAAVRSCSFWLCGGCWCSPRTYGVNVACIDHNSPFQEGCLFGVRNARRGAGTPGGIGYLDVLRGHAGGALSRQPTNPPSASFISFGQFSHGSGRPTFISE